jgi:hypothetical protein
MWLLLITSCSDDILNKAPLTEYTDAVIWSNAELMEAFLAEQYANTPVMVGDATCHFLWGYVPMNRDSRAGDQRYMLGNAVTIQGPVLTLDLTDETKYSDGAQINLVENKANGISSEGGVMEWWENAYYTIRNLNDFIERAPGSPLNPDLIQVRISEARFLRAFCYFAMVKRYGGVPLLTKVPYPDSPDDLLYPKRNSEKELWDFIIEETAEIADILPDISATAYGRVNKWAALALNCRAALYAGSIAKYGTVQLDGLLGMSAGEANGYFQAAAGSAKRIMDDSPFTLYNADADKVENFKNIFLKKNHSEAIFVKKHGGNGHYSGSGQSVWSWDVLESPEPTVWGVGNIHMPYLEFVEEFEYANGQPGTLDRDAIQQGLWTMDDLWKGRDPRFYASVWTNGTAWEKANNGVFGTGVVDMHNGLIQPDGTIIQGETAQYAGVNATGTQLVSHVKRNVVNPGFGIMKYLDPSANNMVWFGESKTDYLVFRLAEILLNYAEASFELGHTEDARRAVNQIRDRAGIALLSAIDLEKIRHERMIELAFENHRYWDLRRWREAETRLTRSFSGLQYILDFNTRKFKIRVVNDVDGTTNPPHFYARNYYFPITKARTGANPNLVENPDY